MGFSAVGNALSGDMLANGVGLLADFQQVIGVVFGIAALGLLFAVLRAFLPR